MGVESWRWRVVESKSWMVDNSQKQIGIECQIRMGVESWGWIGLESWSNFSASIVIRSPQEGCDCFKIVPPYLRNIPAKLSISDF